MADDARTKALRSSIEQAHAALNSLDDAQRQQDPESFGRLTAVLDYAALVVERTDPRLMTDPAYQQLTETLGEIAGNPQNAAANPGQYAFTIVERLMRFPVAIGRELDQDVRQAAGNFRRSASAHINSVKSEAQALLSELRETREQVEASKAEVLEAIATGQRDNHARLAEIEATAAAAKTQVEQQAQTQTEEFERQEARRDEEIQTSWKDLSAALTTEGEGLVAAIKAMRDETKALVGSIGAAGTANHFEREAKRERLASWVAFAITCVALGAAGLVAAKAAEAGTIDTKHLVAKITATLALGGLAAFTASRANDHRQREKQARDRELDLKAFGPFIAPLSDTQQARERILMTRRSFAQNRGVHPDPVDEVAEPDGESA